MAVVAVVMLYPFYYMLNNALPRPRRSSSSRTGYSR